MNLTIIDDDVLKTYERMEKMNWFAANKTILFLSLFIVAHGIFYIATYPLLSSINSNGNSRVKVDPCFIVQDKQFAYFLIFLALLVIVRIVYKRYKVLKGIPLMREYEKQVRKMDMKYDFDETRIRIEYGGLVRECRWSMFQKMRFTKGFLIMYSQFYPMGALCIPLKKEYKTELDEMISVIKTKFKIDVVK